MSPLLLKAQRPKAPSLCQRAVVCQWWILKSHDLRASMPCQCIQPHPLPELPSWESSLTLGSPSLHSCLNSAPSKQIVGRCWLCQHLCRFKKLKPMAVSCYVFGRGNSPWSHTGWMQTPCFILQLAHSCEPLCCQGLWGAILHLEGSDEELQAVIPSSDPDK